MGVSWHMFSWRWKEWKYRNWAWKVSGIQVNSPVSGYQRFFLIYGSQLTYVQLKMERMKIQKLGMKSLWHLGKDKIVVQCCHVVYWCTYVHVEKNTQLMQHNKINTCRLYNKWTLKLSVTNSICVTVCQNVHGKGIIKLIKIQYN